MRPKARIPKLEAKLQHFRRVYLNKQISNLDESSTRIIVNHLLTDILGYRELIEIKTEFPVDGGKADYLIQIGGINKFVVEVKSLDTTLTRKHLKQVLLYALRIGVSWVVLTNGRRLNLYRIVYSKPIKVVTIFELNLSVDARYTSVRLSYLTKKGFKTNQLGILWNNYGGHFKQSYDPFTTHRSLVDVY